MGKTLVLKCPGTVTGDGFRKLENYVGIEFTRNSSDGGGTNGYHKMIGDEELLSTLPLLNKIKPALVKNGAVTAYLNGTNFYKDEDGGDVDVTCADGSDIMIAYPKMYAIIGGTNATYERFIFSDAPFSYDGDEAEEIDSWGETPDYEVIVNGVARSIYQDGTISNTTGATGTGDSAGFFERAGFPATYSTRGGFESAARAKNSSTTSNLPYCNGTMLDWEVLLGLLYLECRTKNIASVFGHGISSNVAVTADNWGTVSGIRVDGTAYHTWGDLTAYGWNGTVGTTSSVLSYVRDALQWHLLHSMDAQMEVSKDTTKFESVSNSDGEALQGIGNGVMTGVYTKTVTFTANCALTADEAIAQHTFECVYRVPVWRGKTGMYGQIWSHMSGYDVVKYTDSNSVNHNILYRAKSVAAIDTDTTEGEQTSETAWNFTKTYERVGDIGYQDGWMKNTVCNSAGRSLVVATGVGAAINNYQSSYSWHDNTIVVGKYYRKTAGLLGGYAVDGTCVPRVVDVAVAPSYAHAAIGSRFRVKLEA